MIIIAGPCVIESRQSAVGIAKVLKGIANRLHVQIIYKASCYKANRTSKDSFRGVGMRAGKKILREIKDLYGLAVTSDCHTVEDIKHMADTLDVIQIPAFLCRQTDLLLAAADTGKTVNVKKGQWVSPQEVKYILEKSGTKSWITERGTFFGYNRLVVDMAGLIDMSTLCGRIIFDATHSVQYPAGAGDRSSGNRSMILPLARAALATGAVGGLFFEVHPLPEIAKCDGDNCLRLNDFEKNLRNLLKLNEAVKCVLSA